jgi:hypothetical protein
MKKLLSLIMLSTLALNSCYAREMYLVDSVINFQEQGIKTILFVGFNSPTGVKVDSRFKSKLEDLIYKEFEKFTSVKILKLNNTDNLPNNYKITDVTNLANKYKSELVIVGDINSYIESKYIDQPVGGFSNAPSIINDNISVRTLNRFQVNVFGNINLIKSNGKVLWTQRIEDIEINQYENTNMVNNTDSSSQELATYVNTRDKLAEVITLKLVRNLLPYYSYK